MSTTTMRAATVDEYSGAGPGPTRRVRAIREQAAQVFAGFVVLLLATVKWAAVAAVGVGTFLAVLQVFWLGVGQVLDGARDGREAKAFLVQRIQAEQAAAQARPPALVPPVEAPAK